MFKRIVKLSKTHSFFLFGARATGKSTLLRDRYDPKSTLFIDLLDNEIEDRLARRPAELENMIEAKSAGLEWVVIDEIQRIPALLDVVHRLSKSKTPKFVLTGSSARKLRRGAANLLAGRAFTYHCHPLTHRELGNAFHLPDVMQFGALPEVFSLSIEDKKDFLRSYVETYFREEIVAEQIVRKLRPFKNFLQVAAQMNGKILNINSIARDVGVDHTTVQNYFEVLEDTLIGFMLEPFSESLRKRQRTSSKFYYFDTGVARSLNSALDVPIRPGTFEYGTIFEHFLICEIRRLSSYAKPDWKLSYLRTKDDAEIDLIIERPGENRVAIEIKSGTDMSLESTKVRSLKELTKDMKRCDAFVFSQDQQERKQDGIWFLHWKKGIQGIGL